MPTNADAPISLPPSALSLQVRSCDGCSAKSPATNETWATSPRWPTPLWSSSSSRTDAAPSPCDGLQDPRRQAPTEAARQRPQQEEEEEERRRNYMNLVLSNKQPLAPDERCAAEPVFKMTPLSCNVISSRQRHFHTSIEVVNSNRQSAGLNKYVRLRVNV